MALTAKPEHRGWTLPKSAKPENQRELPTEQPERKRPSDDREKPLSDALADVRKEAERYADRKNGRGK